MTSSQIALRILRHEWARNVLTTGGIAIAILMIFLQLGFYASVPKAGMLVYDHLRFDILMTSSSYVFQEQAYQFPRQRLYEALAVDEVGSVAPFYQGEGSWLNDSQGLRRDLFVMACRLADDCFKVEDIEARQDLLRKPGAVMIDASTLAMFGPQAPGQHAEVERRAVEVVGAYRLGTGFTGLGAIVVSDATFADIFPSRSLAEVNFGLVRLRAGASPDRAAAALRALLPPDIRIYTRDELARYEETFWRARTSTGLIFGFGVMVSIVVGAVTLYQALTTQVVRQLPQYATLRAIGYADFQLRRIVLFMAFFTSGVAFVPALAGAVAAYAKVRDLARLPIEMTAMRTLVVFVLVAAMSAGTALVAARSLRRADPADLF